MNTGTGIGIATINAAHRIDKLLRNIFETVPYIPKENVVIIDDGSTQKDLFLSREVAKGHGVLLAEHRRNLGISATWNHLVSMLKKNARVILLNDDVEVVPGWVEAIDYFLRNNPYAGLVGLHAYDSDGKIFCTDNGVKRWDVDFSVPHRGLCANGFCFGINMPTFYSLSAFDETYYSFYEEVDLGLHWAKNGFPSYNLPWPVIHHEWGTTFTENPDMLLPKIRMEASRKAFIEKWGGDIKEMYDSTISEIPRKELSWLTAEGVKKGFSIDVVR